MKKSNDPFFRIKEIAYNISQLPPKEEDVTYADVVNHALFTICRERGFSYFDPKWKEYTDEEILIEYHAIIFDKSEEARRKFETELMGGTHDDIKWLENMAEKENERAKQDQEEIEFDPQSMGE